MYLARALSNALQRSLDAFPAVLVTGPRQSGKTTFLRHEVGERYRYASFDDPLERDFALTDPNGFLRAFDDSPALLDEVQHVPELLPYIKLRIDAAPDRLGRWVLTGSQQFALMQQLGESLAGRPEAESPPLATKRRTTSIGTSPPCFARRLSAAQPGA